MPKMLRPYSKMPSNLTSYSKIREKIKSMYVSLCMFPGSVSCEAHAGLAMGTCSFAQLSLAKVQVMVDQTCMIHV